MVISVLFGGGAVTAAGARTLTGTAADNKTGRLFEKIFRDAKAFVRRRNDRLPLLKAVAELSGIIRSVSGPSLLEPNSLLQWRRRFHIQRP